MKISCPLQNDFFRLIIKDEKRHYVAKAHKWYPLTVRACTTCGGGESRNFPWWATHTFNTLTATRHPTAVLVLPRHACLCLANGIHRPGPVGWVVFPHPRHGHITLAPAAAGQSQANGGLSRGNSTSYAPMEYFGSQKMYKTTISNGGR